MEVKIGKTYLTRIPHNGKEISFQFPQFKGNYGDVAEKIDRAGLKRPSSSETASLVYDAFKNPKGEYESEIIRILKDSWLWEFTGNLYLPKSNKEINNGVILDLSPEIKDGRLVMNKSSLVKRLEEDDPNIKFVPFGYKIGIQDVSELGRNPYVLARYGEEGAQKIAEIASEYKEKPGLWSFDSVDEEIVSQSSLGFDCILEIDVNCRNEDTTGYAFGVVPRTGKFL